jgi:hypothetical protein
MIVSLVVYLKMLIEYSMRPWTARSFVVGVGTPCQCDWGANLF